MAYPSWYCSIEDAVRRGRSDGNRSQKILDPVAVVEDDLRGVPEKRDEAAAIKSLETMFDLSGHLKRENTLIHQHIAVTIEALVMDTIEDDMREMRWNTEHYLKI